MKILLASSSPRRRELLKTLGHQVTCVSPNVVELEEKDCDDARLLAQKNANLKASFVFETYGMLASDVIIGADTVVYLPQSKIFGKPSSIDNAKEILSTLSGKTHNIVTAYCVIGKGGIEKTGHVISTALMRHLTDEEISSYVSLGECMDKAGAYAVSGAGASLMAEIHGSISNIIGLPINEVIDAACEIINKH